MILGLEHFLIFEYKLYNQLTKNVFYFKGNQVNIWEESSVRYAYGYPRPIGNTFQGAPTSIDAAFNAPNGNLYFFYGQQ